MTKHLIDSDQSELDAAREALGTTSVGETVRGALSHFVSINAARQDIATLADPTTNDLSNPEIMKQAWL